MESSFVLEEVNDNNENKNGFKIPDGCLFMPSWGWDWISAAQKLTDAKITNSVISAIKKYGNGTGGSRLVTGTSNLHSKLESDIAKFKKTDDAIVFSSGYLASIGTISSIMNKDDIIFSDELNHACLIDGARLSRSKIVIYKHSNMKDLESKLKKFKTSNGKKMIISDSVFSMDGDIAPLDSIVKLSKKYDLK